MKQLTVRQINALTRDGGNGRNVYHAYAGSNALARVIKARTIGGVFQLRLLCSSKWITVGPDDIVTDRPDYTFTTR